MCTFHVEFQWTFQGPEVNGERRTANLYEEL
jgi:hypothetical protein